MEEKKDKPPQKDELDIARGIEGVLLGLFLLFIRIFRTCYTFVVNPRTFADSVSSINPLDKSFPSQFARPLTYFSVSLAILITVFTAVIVPLNPDQFLDSGNPFYLLVLDAVKGGNIPKIIIGLSPFIAGLGVYAYCISWCSTKCHRIISFTNSLKVISYFAGTFFLLNLILGLLVGHILSKLQTNPFEDFIIFGSVIFIWVALVRSVFSFLYLLKAHLNISWPDTISLFVRATFVFFLLCMIVVKWFGWELTINSI